MKRGSRWILGAIAAIGLLPLLAAWYLVNHPGLIGKPSNHGELIHPLRRMEYELLQPVGELPSRPLEELRGRWVVLHFVPKACDQACQKTFANTYKLHLLLNKDIFRVRRLAILPEVLEEETLKFLRQDQDLYFARLDPAFLEKLVQEIAKVPLKGDQVMLIDPLGNLMMWYDSNFDPSGLYRDLQRLLRASRIG